MTGPAGAPGSVLTITLPRKDPALHRLSASSASPLASPSSGARRRSGSQPLPTLAPAQWPAAGGMEEGERGRRPAPQQQEQQQAAGVAGAEAGGEYDDSRSGEAPPLLALLRASLPVEEPLGGAGGPAGADSGASAAQRGQQQTVELLYALNGRPPTRGDFAAGGGDATVTVSAGNGAADRKKRGRLGGIFSSRSRSASRVAQSEASSTSGVALAAPPDAGAAAEPGTAAATKPEHAAAAAKPPKVRQGGWFSSMFSAGKAAAAEANGSPAAADGSPNSSLPTSRKNSASGAAPILGGLPLMETGESSPSASSVGAAGAAAGEARQRGGEERRPGHRTSASEGSEGGFSGTASPATSLLPPAPPDASAAGEAGTGGSGGKSHHRRHRSLTQILTLGLGGHKARRRHSGGSLEEVIGEPDTPTEPAVEPAKPTGSPALSCFGLGPKQPTVGDHEELCVPALPSASPPAAQPLDLSSLELEEEPVVLPLNAMGIRNTGNSCFLSAALQCLRHTPGLPLVLVPDLQELRAAAEGGSPGPAQQAAPPSGDAAQQQQQMAMNGEAAQQQGEQQQAAAGVGNSVVLAPAGAGSAAAESPEGEAAAAAEAVAPGATDPAADSQGSQGVVVPEVAAQGLAAASGGVTPPEAAASHAAEAAAAAAGPSSAEPGTDQAAAAAAAAAPAMQEAAGLENSPAAGGSQASAVQPAGDSPAEPACPAAVPDEHAQAGGAPQPAGATAVAAGAGAVAAPAAAAAAPTTPGRPERGELLACVASVVKELYTQDVAASVDPYQLLCTLKRFPTAADYFDGGQHDCQEVLRLMMDLLHEDMNRVPRPAPTLPEEEAPAEPGEPEGSKADREWRRYLARDSSPITDLFSGQLQSSVTCHGCGRRFTMYEPFWDLSLPLAKEGKNSNFSWLGIRGTPASLQDCLRVFTADETLEGEEAFHCEVCRDKTSATKHLRIHRFPDALVLHIKRFKYKGSNTDKLTANVAFPLKELCLHQFASPESPAAPEDCVYDLFAVSNHFGTLSGGHYTALGRVPLGSGREAWYSYNDEVVSKVPAQQVVSQHAYILFYARRKYKPRDGSARGSARSVGSGTPSHHTRSSSGGTA